MHFFASRFLCTTSILMTKALVTTFCRQNFTYRMRTGYWKLVWHQIRRPRLFLRDHHQLIFRLHLSFSFDSKSIRPKDWSTDIMSFDDPWRMTDYLRRGFKVMPYSSSNQMSRDWWTNEKLRRKHLFENPPDSFFKQSSFNLLNVISIEIAKY